MTAPIVAGIDYNLRRIDVGVVRGNELLSAQAFDLGRDVPAQVGSIERALATLLVFPVVLIVMEEPWARAEAGIRTALKLHKIPTRIETIAAQMGIPVRYVPVPTWHLNVLGNGGLKTDAAKAASRRYVEMVYRKSIASADTCDSVCLGTYGGQLLAREERMAI